MTTAADPRAAVAMEILEPAELEPRWRPAFEEPLQLLLYVCVASRPVRCSRRHLVLGVAKVEERVEVLWPVVLPDVLQDGHPIPGLAAGGPGPERLDVVVVELALPAEVLCVARSAQDLAKDGAVRAIVVGPEPTVRKEGADR